MKTIKLLLCGILLGLIAIPSCLQAAYVNNMPVMRIQPNGDTLRCFATGDEFYHRLHDAQGYTIVQDPTTGYWVYATITTQSQKYEYEVIPSQYIPGAVDPSTTELVPGICITREEAAARHKAWEVPEEYRRPNTVKDGNRNHGNLNNLVIFIRFADDNEISTPFSYIDNMYNDSASNAVSVLNYFRHMSYNNIDIRTYFYPTPNGNQVISYQDSLPRCCFQPYNENTNPNGYTYQVSTEFALLERAVNYINANYVVDPSINLDVNNDGDIDNITFVVKGAPGGWNDLLWPHKWNLFTRDVRINGKRVNTFNLLLEGGGTSYFGPSTFCHEMFHTLGAPDLYHYYNYTEVHPVGSWDLMEYNQTPPQHPNTYMKYKYGNWIDSIPEITEDGVYTLHSVADPENYNNCYKIAAQEPYQFYLIEYRDNEEIFETALPGKGITIYRIDTRFEGNASFDGQSTFDEVWLFRPGGNSDVANGNYSQAALNPTAGRTAFTPETDPYPWLTGNVIDTTLSITNVTINGETASFTYRSLRGCAAPGGLFTTKRTGNSARILWKGGKTSYVVKWRMEGDSANTHYIHTRDTFANLTELEVDTPYEWCVMGYCADDSSHFSMWEKFRTNKCITPSGNTIGEATITDNILPVAITQHFSLTEQIFLSEEVGDSLEISQIGFYYASNTQLSDKRLCDIYIGHTDKTMFENNDDMIPDSLMQLVYSGALNCIKGWNDIILDRTFSYNGTDNIVIAVDDNSDASTSGKFYIDSTAETMSLCYYSNMRNPNISNPSNYNGVKSRKKVRNYIRIMGCRDEEPLEIIPTSTPKDIITVQDRNINVRSNSSSDVVIFDVMGRELARQQGRPDHTTVLSVQLPGVYLVRVGNKPAQKVVVL